jgi:hypothetical protein
LWTENPDGDEIIVYEAKNEQEETEFIISTITELKYKTPNFSYADVAILYRTNAQSRTIEEVLHHHRDIRYRWEVGVIPLPERSCGQKPRHLREETAYRDQGIDREASKMRAAIRRNWRRSKFLRQAGFAAVISAQGLWSQ